LRWLGRRDSGKKPHADLGLRGVNGCDFGLLFPLLLNGSCFSSKGYGMFLLIALVLA
jgi:hypothetical protein